MWLKREGSLGLAWLRLDGFVALEAADEAGTITTKPFPLEGKHLELNVDARDHGMVRVELLDEAGQPMDGFSGDHAEWFRGVDQLRFQPVWTSQADLATFKGKTIRLKIHLKNARLYAFHVRP